MRRKVVDKIIRGVKKAEESIIKRYKERQICEEEDITAQLAGKISELTDGLEEEDFKISAKVYTRRGKKSEEKITGADLAVVLESNSIKKAFLAQSKKGVRINGRLKIIKDKRLRVQCQKMLEISSDSFVIVYTPGSIFVTPALEINDAKNHYKRLHTFFTEFLKCFIGDHKIVELVKEPEKLLEFATTVLYIKVNYLIIW